MCSACLSKFQTRKPEKRWEFLSKLCGRTNWGQAWLCGNIYHISNRTGTVSDALPCYPKSFLATFGSLHWQHRALAGGSHSTREGGEFSRNVWLKIDENCEVCDPLKHLTLRLSLHVHQSLFPYHKWPDQFDPWPSVAQVPDLKLTPQAQERHGETRRSQSRTSGGDQRGLAWWDKQRFWYWMWQLAIRDSWLVAALLLAE